MIRKTILAVFAAAASAFVLSAADSATLKMTPQAIRLSAYEATISANIIIVKPEVMPEAVTLKPEIFTATVNGVERVVKHIYTCDDRGVWTDGGEYLAFGLETNFGYKGQPSHSRANGQWDTHYPVKLDLKKGKSIKVNGKKVTAIECEAEDMMRGFLSEADHFRRGTFTGPTTGKSGDQTLTYGAYEPWSLKSDGVKNPLVIWLHGGGEGGLDVSITLLGNEVVALIREDIQNHFTTEGGDNGAYVLSIQCPTMWMNTVSGDVQLAGTTMRNMTMGETPSLYSDVLKSTIDHYLAENPDVDRNRIYIGGCSNGGYMTFNMLIRHPKFFAAAFPTCEAYADANITDNQIKLLAKENIWIVQSIDDTTVDPKVCCIPTYQRLVKAGAENVWMSMFENVQGIDNPGQKLFGHFSWCYLFNDAVTASQEHSDEIVPSNNGGGSVAPQGHANIYEWMNAQVLKDEPAPQGGMFGGGNRGGNRGAGRGARPQGGEIPQGERPW